MTDNRGDRKLDRNQVEPLQKSHNWDFKIIKHLLVFLCSRLYDEHPQEVCGQCPESVWD